MDMILPACGMLCTHDGRPRATVTGYVTHMDSVKKTFSIHVVQKVLQSEITTYINVIACMDSCARTCQRKSALPEIGNFISFMATVLFFADDVAFVHVTDVGFVIHF